MRGVREARDVAVAQLEVARERVAEAREVGGRARLLPGRLAERRRRGSSRRRASVGHAHGLLEVAAQHGDQADVVGVGVLARRPRLERVEQPRRAPDRSGARGRPPRASPAGRRGPRRRAGGIIVFWSQNSSACTRPSCASTPARSRTAASAAGTAVSCTGSTRGEDRRAGVGPPRSPQTGPFGVISTFAEASASSATAIAAGASATREAVRDHVGERDRRRGGPAARACPRRRAGPRRRRRGCVRLRPHSTAGLNGSSAHVDERADLDRRAAVAHHLERLRRTSRGSRWRRRRRRRPRRQLRHGGGGLGAAATACAPASRREVEPALRRVDREHRARRPSAAP